jgi:D-alanyl-D-alanine carboxypeptidase/D-alanyl-D-alanine-endopeptidase (penicillin-binding protein 4)
VRRPVSLTLALAFVAGLVLPFVAASTAQAAPAAVASLQLTPPDITFGETQEASGTVQADPPCAAGRSVRLERKPAGSSTWEQVESTTSSGDGSFSFSLQPQANAGYRAIVEIGGVTCDEIDSDPVAGRVFAKVELTAGRPKVPAGECVKLKAAVKPPKPGQRIRLQQRTGQDWATVGPIQLDGDSRAVVSRCYAFQGLGVHAFRALWPKQDQLNGPGQSDPAQFQVVRAAWMLRVEHLIGGRTLGLSIRAGGRVLYDRGAEASFVPASNEKLLLSMALLNRFDPASRISTIAAARAVAPGGVVKGDLWIIGRGDPSIGKRQMAQLAQAVSAAGVHRIGGRIMGATGYFAHDWFAHGWKPEFPSEEVGLPSALAFRENHLNGTNVHDPERSFAEMLTRRLEAHGIKVHGRPGAGSPPGHLVRVGGIDSPPLAAIMAAMDQHSDNFYAEMLGKLLGASTGGVPGTIAKGAAAIRSFTRHHGAAVTAYDASGLSYANRATTAAVTKLLQFADTTAWGETLRNLLAEPGEGTLEDRLHGVKLHAKTGTLDDISALSGWVWLTRLKTWAQFSILDRGMPSYQSKPLEDSIVRTVARDGH